MSTTASIRRPRHLLVPALSIFLLLTLANAYAAEWHVATNGTASAKGTADAPWELAFALQAQQLVKPGDIVWIHEGTYRFPDRKAGAMGYVVRLTGMTNRPIELRAMPSQRVTIDGGLSLQGPSTFVWLRDLEILVSENLSQSRRIEESGSHPQSYGRPWGGLNIYSGSGCKFINLIIHDNAQGVSWWAGSTDSEMHGCILYDNGWRAPDRGHGHAIYTQNRDGTKIISDCLMTGGYGYSLHAYGSSRADVDNYLVTGNVFYEAGPFLIGSGKPSHHIQVLSNYLYGVSIQLGYDAPYNEDCEVSDNAIINGSLSINKYRQVVKERNFVLAKTDSRPSTNEVIIRPNRYDPNRAHLILFNWEQKPQMKAQLGHFLKPGDSFGLLNPRDVYGKPVAAGIYDGKPIALSMTGEFAVFVLIKQAAR